MLFYMFSTHIHRPYFVYFIFFRICNKKKQKTNGEMHVIVAHWRKHFHNFRTGEYIFAAPAFLFSFTSLPMPFYLFRCCFVRCVYSSFFCFHFYHTQHNDTKKLSSVFFLAIFYGSTYFLSWLCVIATIASICLFASVFPACLLCCMVRRF